MKAAWFRCMCGSGHSLRMDQALDGIGIIHWLCTDCRRRFVLTHQPPDGFAPVFLDPGVRSVLIRETGPSNPNGTINKAPVPPPAIEFKCRCGETITAHSWMYGGTAVCTGCRTTLYLALKYNVRQKTHVILPEYPHTTSKA